VNFETDRFGTFLGNHSAASAIAASALDTLRTRHRPAGMVAKLPDIYRQAAEGAVPIAAATAAGH